MPLEQDEHGEEHRRHAEQSKDERIAPAVFVRLDQAVRQREQRDRRCHESGQVEPLLGRVPRLVDEDPRREDAEDSDRDVDVEDPAPVDVLGDRAADERAERERHRGYAGPDSDRSPALPRWERGGDDRQRRRVHQRCAHTLHDARADQHAGAVREPAEERRRGEDHEPGDEDAPAAEHVGELAAGEEQHSERQGVAVDDPFELGDRDAEIRTNRRQRDVHDRVVQHDHEQAERDGEQRPPLAVLRCEEARSHQNLGYRCERLRLDT